MGGMMDMGGGGNPAKPSFTWVRRWVFTSELGDWRSAGGYIVAGGTYATPARVPVTTLVADARSADIVTVGVAPL